MTTIENVPPPHGHSLTESLASLRLKPPPSQRPPPPPPRIDDALLAQPIADLRAALAGSPRGVLVTGGDAVSRRAVVARCLDDGAAAAALGTVDDAAAAARAQLRLDAAGPRTLVAVAADERAVPAALLRAGRLESVVRIGPPAVGARRRAWLCVLEALGVGAEEVGVYAGLLASASPAFGLGDVRRVVYGAVAQAGGEEGVGPAELLSLVRAARPEATVQLDFVTYGSGRGSDTDAGGGRSRGTLGTWDGVGGYASVKLLLDKLVEWPIAHADTFVRLGVDAPRGILLHGPPGCGKSLLVHALLNKLTTSNWMKVDGPGLFSRYLGDSESRVRAVFAQARALEPCIVFIDELEALAGNRSAGDDTGGVERRVLGALLAELDGTAAGKVFVIACANKLEDVDPALIRSGRIDNVVPIGLPDEDDREDILRTLTAQMSVRRTTGGDQLRTLATRTAGLTGADLSKLCREAAMEAICRDETSGGALQWRHFDAARSSLRS